MVARAQSIASAANGPKASTLVTRPVAVAITGGIGAGKSEALKAFARNGAATVSSDQIVHHLLRRPEVRDAVVARMGHGIVGPDGEIDRGALATVVFNDREALGWLEDLLHPLVSIEYLQWREQLAELPEPPRVSVTEVPLLYETGGEARFDKVVVITAPSKLRKARSVVATDDREARLIPDAEKVQRADFAFKNTGSLEELDAFVKSVMAELSSA
jgi:dephospho-CoA kinase